MKINLSIAIKEAEANHHIPAFELEARHYVNRTMADLLNVFNETVKSTTLVTNKLLGHISLNFSLENSY